MDAMMQELVDKHERAKCTYWRVILSCSDKTPGVSGMGIPDRQSGSVPVTTVMDRSRVTLLMSPCDGTKPTG